MNRAELLKLIDELRLENALLKEQLAAQAVLLAAKDQEIALLKTRVAELERRLGLDSSTSSKPPSSDGLRKKPAPQSLRPKGTRPSGGQYGHKGTTLKQVETPDEVVHHAAPGHCPECTSSLAEIVPTAVMKRQVFDIPPIEIQVTEHQAEVKVCGACDTRVVGLFPEGVTAPVQYGEHIQAMAVYLHNQQLIPEDRIRDLFQDLFGLSITPATIIKMGKAFAAKVATYVAVICIYLKRAPVKNADESGFRMAGKTGWLHVLCNLKATFYRVSEKRGDIVQGLKGILCHDFFSPYFKLNTKHAVCNAHILRELKSLIVHEHEPWARWMTHLLRLIGSVSKDEMAIRRLKWRILPLYDQIVAKGIAYHEALPLLPQKAKGKLKRRDGHNLLLRLQHYKDDVLRCLDLKTPGVPFTNNQAEQDIRMLKVKQKISGGFRGSEGAETFATIRSFLSTMRKQGHPLFGAITKTLQGEPPPFLG